MPLSESEALQRKVDTVHVPITKKNDLSTAGAMAITSATSFGKLFIGLSRGALVEIPVAAADGLRAIPQIYNHEVKDYGKATDWKSGVVVAGKTFSYGIYEGFTDIFIQTYQGKKKQGAAGVAKGLAKGLVSMTTKTTAGVIGLVAYPAQGISNSIRTVMKSTAWKSIVDAKFAEGEWLVKTEAGKLVDRALLGAEFEFAKNKSWDFWIMFFGLRSGNFQSVSAIDFWMIQNKEEILLNH